jgi:hypothetical protein
MAEKLGAKYYTPKNIGALSGPLFYFHITSPILLAQHICEGASHGKIKSRNN